MNTEPARIPWYEPRTDGRELEYISRALSANHPNQGPLTKELEQGIASRLGVKHAVAVTSGTVAIFLALKAAGIGHGDEVLVPDLTFIATANAVRLAGAEPVFVDVEAERMTIDPGKLAEAITPRTKAIIPVHITGRPAFMREILAFAKERGLAVIEDAAEALFSKHDGKFLGTFGVAGCFSFSAMKLLSTGQGGMVVTNDDAFVEKLRGLRNHGIVARGTGGDDIHPSLGFNFKFTDIQAGVGLAQLERADERIRQSVARHRLYVERLSKLPDVRVLPFDLEEGNVPLWTDIVLDRRDELSHYLEDRGIDTRRFWHPIHTQAPYRQDDARFPVAKELSSKTLWLSSAFHSPMEDFSRVCDAIESFFASA